MEILEAAIKAKHGAYESVEAKYDAYKSVKSYSDACKVLGIKPYPFKKGAKIGDMDLSLDVVDVAKIKLITITKALNKLDNCKESESYYVDLTGAAITLDDSADIKDIFNFFVARKSGEKDEYDGLMVTSTLYDKPMLSSLAYHSHFIARYSAKQFLSLWGEYLTGKESIPWRELEH
ncbi:MAG: hypothetical protein LKH27_08235 [Prevotella sp.]|jgi:hypothetical protein|nr:hypothetical protein [Prevotella sp.]MCH3993013.1 hypothetical protein [Prevotella sp.]MCI1474386.1 hypothetical protein [Prevotella sp.]MCI1596059.1 hypothetical protein [Prevotella sp.]